MDPFIRHRGPIAVVPDDDIDTDRIIPARFLTRISRFGYGELLFADVRSADFPLDQLEANGASILVTGTNFGCGSSREHAVWALQQAGFRAVIARRDPDSPGYSDIFRQNSANCGLLLIELLAADHENLPKIQGSEIEIDLPGQTVKWNGGEASFEINAATKAALVEGLDLIGTTLQYDAAIGAFESKPTFVPAA
jgi:3-isopropylmalate/(R)-2-methylmalate dehydratase small subunit